MCCSMYIHTDLVDELPRGYCDTRVFFKERQEFGIGNACWGFVVRMLPLLCSWDGERRVGLGGKKLQTIGCRRDAEEKSAEMPTRPPNEDGFLSRLCGMVGLLRSEVG